MLSAGMFDGENRTLWKVVAEDSRGLPEGTRAAVEHLANVENVMAIVAVTGTTEAIEAAREANKWGVPIILNLQRRNHFLERIYLPALFDAYPTNQGCS